MLMEAFVCSQFSYCPLIWMFHSRKIEHRINSIHKRALKLVYQDFLDLTFKELLTKDKSDQKLNQKLILGHLNVVLVKFARNMLGE